MMISRRSWRCLSRRAFARISIMVRLGESSMNSGADDTSPILRTSLIPVVVAHRPVAHVVHRDPRLGRQQPHGDLGAAHLEREDDARQAVADGRRAGDVEPERRVVGRDHRPARKVEMVGRCRPRRSEPRRCSTGATPTIFQPVSTPHSTRGEVQWVKAACPHSGAATAHDVDLPCPRSAARASVVRISASKSHSVSHW